MSAISLLLSHGGMITTQVSHLTTAALFAKEFFLDIFMNPGKHKMLLYVLGGITLLLCVGPMLLIKKNLQLRRDALF